VKYSKSEIMIEPNKITPDFEFEDQNLTSLPVCHLPATGVGPGYQKFSLACFPDT